MICPPSVTLSLILSTTNCLYYRSETDCSICLSKENPAPCITLECGHCFHQSCIVPWFRSSNKSHGTCPECRDNPYGASEVTSSRSFFQIAVDKCRSKGASAVSKKMYNNYKNTQGKLKAKREEYTLQEISH